MHTSNPVKILVNIRHAPTPYTASLRIASTKAAEVTAQLISENLGPEALNYYRSPERTFPLRHRDSYYSVSHTSAVTVLAVAATPVGVDVERQLSDEATTDLAWALSPEERSELAVSEESCLTEIWTAKEAAGKALGVGLGTAPNRILTLPVPDRPGHRVAEVRRSDSDAMQMLTYGWWFGNHHIRLAWPTPKRLLI
ncbi:4'-phosphopantetheinyl transferase family protein [Arthrobacter antibioticus]|uniref:4'-phosphopantetheinyl transferase family protein n=1 Tax=Arthrobacter sp. H35-MC1 TaxID=3046203 RepID=UPI0024BA508B|nr:4'-phosphopantetheinyl transferase superfamily protein [Arthrobacter sp. H35-MC1]MDJ0318676.1 4'-phosphopantetheinyl transferase superfamily protein [Arthrobacter sp. H35-MC1]